MIVAIRLFARFRELAGDDVLQVSLPERATVSDLISTVMSLHPDWSELLLRSAVAVNDDYASLDRILVATDDIALIPPVSGGSFSHDSAYPRSHRLS